MTAEFPYLNLEPIDANGNFPPIRPYNAAGDGYTWIFSDVADQAGVGGQNNADPASIFDTHLFVQLTVGNDVRWFDPSYGVEYTGPTQGIREQFFETVYVSGYGAKVGAGIREAEVGLDLGDGDNSDGVGDSDGDTNDIVEWGFYLIKPNDFNTRELDFEIVSDPIDLLS